MCGRPGEADCQIQESLLLNLAALVETGLTSPGTGAALRERKRSLREERTTSSREKSQERSNKLEKRPHKRRPRPQTLKKTTPCMSDHMCAHPPRD
jgi:hypothetical protein